MTNFGKNGQQSIVDLTSQNPKGGLTSQPVTYTWENIEAEVDVVEGSCRKKQTTRKRILDHGKISEKLRFTLRVT
jgi:hypothetical protein